MSATIDPVPPSADSLAEAKVYLRLDDGSEDALLARLLGAATALCEGFTGIVLITRAVAETVPAGSAWRRLTLTPVTAIGPVEGRAGVDAPFALAVDTYAIDIDAAGDGWSHKSGRGREHRVAVTIWDDGESPARLHQLIAAAEDAIEAIPPDLDGHRIASLTFLRSRVLRDPDGPWAGIIEYRVRTLEL